MANPIPTVPRSQQLAWYIDVDRCISCRGCEGACKQQNGLEPGMRWRQVIEREGGEYPDPFVYHVSMSCSHCDQPACLKACPVNAISKREKDGIVLIDQALCNGCKQCVWACPYGAPQFNEQTRKVEKCNFCVDRIDQGLAPACVASCMGMALHYGTVEDVEKTYSTEASFDESGFADPAHTRPNIRWKKPRRS